MEFLFPKCIELALGYMMGLDNLISSVGLDPLPGHKQPLTLTTAFPVSAEVAEPPGLVGTPHAGVFLKQSGK